MTVHVLIIVRAEDEICWRCRLLRAALICLLLSPDICARRCERIAASLGDHAGGDHA